MALWHISYHGYHEKKKLGAIGLFELFFWLDFLKMLTN